MKLPECCGSQMKINMETLRYTEVQCGKCGDIVYLKKSSSDKPVMIDD